MMLRIIDIMIIQHRALLSPQLSFGDLILSFHYHIYLGDFQTYITYLATAPGLPCFIFNFY